MTYAHTSKLFLDYIYPWLFNGIQGSIYKERVLIVYSTYTLITNKFNLHKQSCNSWVLVTLVSWVLVTLVSWVFVTLTSIHPCKPNGNSSTLEFDLKHHNAKKNDYYGLNWNVGHYNRNLNFDDSNRHQLLRSRFGHQ